MRAITTPAGQQAITPAMVGKFATTARERMRIDGGGYRRDHLRALSQRVEVADGEVRIMGSKGDQLRTLAAASGIKSAAPGVRSSVLKWRRGQSRANPPPPAIPCSAGKIQGISLLSGTRTGGISEFAASPLGFGHDFPARQSRQFYRANTEPISAIRRVLLLAKRALAGAMTWLGAPRPLAYFRALRGQC